MARTENIASTSKQHRILMPTGVIDNPLKAMCKKA
jgi:hypothetical protein